MPYVITYMQNLKCNTNEVIHETETDSQMQRMDLWLTKDREVGEGQSRRLGLVDANYYIQDG